MRKSQIHKVIIMFLVLLGLATATAQADVAKGTSSNTSKAIYGTDSRIDYYNMSSSWQKVARSTVSLISKSKISKYGSDKAFIQTKSYGFDNNLCADEKFYYQKTAAFCSGALVGPDLVLTAGHCVEDLVDCDSTNIVLDFLNEYSWSDPSTVDSSKVYGCSKIIAQTKTSTNDYALIQLDRPVLDRGNLVPASTGSFLPTGTKLAVLGNPWGLPTKMAEGEVTNDGPLYYFEANLDTYAGNSGSPVINKSTGLIEGILVRGNDDFVDDASRSCKRSAVYADNSTNAEEVTRINQVASTIRAFNSYPTPALKCSLSVPSQPVLYGETFKTSWRVDGHIPADGSVSLYSYVDGKLVFNNYSAYYPASETNTNTGADQTIERGMIVRDRFGNILCQTGSVKFVQAGLASSKATKVGSYITHLYTSILGRQPEDSGFAYWYELAVHGKVSCAQMPASFLSDAEFKNRNRQLNTAGFVTALYQLVFQREPDADGLQYWVNSLSNGQNTRQTVVDQFLASQEFEAQCRSYGLNGAGSFTMPSPLESLPDGLEARKATPIGSYVMHLYSSILGRQPDDSGFNFWYELAVQRKVSCAQLPASFLSSPEFQTRNRQLNRTSYMTALYQLVFQREPDAQGLQFWVNGLNSGEATRQSALNSFLASPEMETQCRSYGLDGAGSFTMDTPVENLP